MMGTTNALGLSLILWNFQTMVLNYFPCKKHAIFVDFHWFTCNIGLNQSWPHSQWESRNNKTSPLASLAPARRALRSNTQFIPLESLLLKCKKDLINPCLPFSLRSFTFEGNFLWMYRVSLPWRCFLSLASSTNIISCKYSLELLSKTLQIVRISGDLKDSLKIFQNFLNFSSS